MKSKKFTDCLKNAVGTMFLLAGAFFVCSTLLSMRAVLADPVAPVETVVATGASVQSARANTSPRTTRASPRAKATTSNATVARTATNTPTRTTTSGRTVVSRTAANQNVASRATRTNSASGRNVVARSGAVAQSDRVAKTTGRNVVARMGPATGANMARISLQGNAIRGSKVNSSNSYTYLSSKLYTGNYSNIIDSTTGLISADAYSNCLESYYTCMDEICTARNASQGRCACAYRTKAFQEAENALTTANEELIKVSGELALLVATGGKDVSAAFQLTDAEKVMNCVSWQEMRAKYKGGYVWMDNGQFTKTKSSSAIDSATYWCNSHGLYQNCDADTKPKYCDASGNNFGFDIKNIEGSSSDILASLQAWADAKENAVSMVLSDDTSLLSAYTNLANVVSGLNLSIDGTSSNTSLDNLANTWGYELFQYAHNNVCGRVLDSCFNGIFEACGNPPSGGKCANGATSSCPYNYNSNITVSGAGDVVLNERGSSTSSTTSTSASCFGYTSSSGDPYSSLRGPVADARRSVMQKYLLDANAACDAYGERLRATAQNIGYQKVAAQQALQQKRMEFAQADADAMVSDYQAARNNFNECLSELYDCYTTQEQSNNKWSTSRIKTYCHQVSNVPHCYDQMVCDAPNNKLAAVITRDTDKSTDECKNSTDFKDNNCRTVLTLNEILSSNYANGKAAGTSAALREACLQKASIEALRNWRVNDSSERLEWGDTRRCIPFANGIGYQTYTGTWGDCEVIDCEAGYTLNAESTACVADSGTGD